MAIPGAEPLAARDEGSPDGELPARLSLHGRTRSRQATSPGKRPCRCSRPKATPPATAGSSLRSLAGRRKAAKRRPVASGQREEVKHSPTRGGRHYRIEDRIRFRICRTDTEMTHASTSPCFSQALELHHHSRIDRDSLFRNECLTVNVPEQVSTWIHQTVSDR